MSGRHAVGLVLSILTVPVLVLGLFDPLEGGLAMLAAGVLIVVTWLVSRVPVPRLEWISWLATVAAGVSAIAGAVWVNVDRGYVIGGAEGVPAWVLVLVALYEIGVLVTIAGGIAYVVRHVTTGRSAAPTGPTVRSA
jgi:hypothetical protein